MAPHSIIRAPDISHLCLEITTSFISLQANTTPSKPLSIMGKGSKSLKDFIVGIPDGKLSGFTSGEHKLYSDINFRLDNQGV
jgi:hypothetical protein